MACAVCAKHVELKNATRGPADAAAGSCLHARPPPPLSQAGMPTTPAGCEWLQANAERDGVKETASGMQYRILRQGDGGAKSPLAMTPCECHCTVNPPI